MTEAEFDEQFPNLPIRWQTPRDSRWKRLAIKDEANNLWIEIPTVVVPVEDDDEAS